LDDAVQEQLLDVLTETDPAPPLAEKFLLDGDSEYVQFIPSCVTVCVSPPAVIMAFLVLVLVLAVAL
jgi:hypothetical protein